MKTHHVRRWRLLIVVASMSMPWFASHGYAKPVNYVVRFRVTAVTQSPTCPNVRPGTNFGCANLVGDVHVGTFVIDDALLARTGTNLPGTITNFFLQIGTVKWDQASPFPSSDFRG